MAYVEKRVEQIISCNSPRQPHEILNTSDYTYERLLAIRNREDPIPKTTSAAGTIMLFFNAHMVEWQYEENLGLKQLWQLPEQRFVVKRNDVIDFVEWKMSDMNRKYSTVNGKLLGREIHGSWEHGKMPNQGTESVDCG
jgi:hypothetical protein